MPEVSGALVAMDPHTGRVLAISGGFSFETSQFDRATQAKRQPGSSIKPFVYLTALDHGFTPSTLVDDSPISLPQGPGLPMWTPTNYTTTEPVPRADTAARRSRAVAQYGDGAGGDSWSGSSRSRRRSSASASWTTPRGNTRWRSGPARRRCCGTPPPMRCSSTAASG